MVRFSKMKWFMLLACCSFISACSDSADVKNDDVKPVAADFTQQKQAITTGTYVSDDDHSGVVEIVIVRDWTSDGKPSRWETWSTAVLFHPDWIITSMSALYNMGTLKYMPGFYDYRNNFRVRIGDHFYKFNIDDPKLLWDGIEAGFGESGVADYYGASGGAYSNRGRHGVIFLKLEETIPESIAKPIRLLPSWLDLEAYLDEDKPITFYGYGYNESGSLGFKNKDEYYKEDFYPTPYANGLIKNDRWNTSEVTTSYFANHPDISICNQYGYECYTTQRESIYSQKWSYTLLKGGLCRRGDVGAPGLVTIGGVEYIAMLTAITDKYCSGWSIHTDIDRKANDIIETISKQYSTPLNYYQEICDNGVDDDGDGAVDEYDSDCRFCNDGIVNVGEDCDGTLFSEDKTNCTDWNSNIYSGGKVKCTNECTIDYSGCTLKEYCGDGKLKADESCDGNVFINGITSCAQYRSIYTGGMLKCNSNCTINTDGCINAPVCGDGIVNGSEPCDGNLFLGNVSSCYSMNPEIYQSGNLVCNNCQISYESCVPWCGNGVLNTNRSEVCDGTDFGGATCESLVGSGSHGTLKCSSKCDKIDISGCSKPNKCGDNVLDDGEDCDGTHFKNNVTTCEAYDGSRYNTGELKCNPNCTINVDYCAHEPRCNDGVVEGDEVCDGTSFLGGKTSCKTLFPELYSGGSVKCTNRCTYDTSNCQTWCGNGSVNTKYGDIMINEVCDHSANGDKFPTNANSCEKVVGAGSAGKLICSNDCKTIITSGCTEPAYCGDGRVNNAELCDGNAFKDGHVLCSDWDSKYDSGNVKCTSLCGLDFSGCIIAPKCGDNAVNQSSEECDGIRFKDDKTMCSDWDSKYISGRVNCKSDCKLDYSNCQEQVIIPDEICNNNIDDDGDNKTDCDDPDCASDLYCEPKPVCHNGTLEYEEDCDANLFLFDETRCAEWSIQFVAGTVSCNDDCTLNYDNCRSIPFEICDNNIDDNGNGRIDCNDTDCIGNPVCNEVVDPVSIEICGNNIDDDENGKTDCEDDACKSDPSCNQTEGCGNGILNDGEDCDKNQFINGISTCADYDSSKYNTGDLKCNSDCSISVEDCRSVAGEICNDKIDNDDDGKIDCEDSDCTNDPACKSAGNDPVEICGNGQDDDQNGKTDCEDDACKNEAACQKEKVEICGNGQDDDGNGKTDCEDDACKNEAACQSDKPVDDPGNKPVDDPGNKPVDDPSKDDGNSGKDGGCSATPLNAAGGKAIPFMLGLLGLGMVRRRREN